MNTRQTSEIRELTAVELDDVAGGSLSLNMIRAASAIVQTWNTAVSAINENKSQTGQEIVRAGRA